MVVVGGRGVVAVHVVVGGDGGGVIVVVVVVGLGIGVVVVIVVAVFVFVVVVVVVVVAVALGAQENTQLYANPSLTYVKCSLYFLKPLPPGPGPQDCACNSVTNTLARIGFFYGHGSAGDTQE